MAARDPIRLGGMALSNGVLVHGPTAWACAIRTADGEVEVVARRKRLIAARITNPVLRGPAKLLEAFAVLPQVRRALPAARLPFERPAVLAAMLGSAALTRGLRRSPLQPAVRELAGGLLSLAPAVLALRGGELAGYHGAEHISIGSYEHGEARPKEHERCGSHLVGPVILTTAAGNVLAGRLPERFQRTGRAVAAVGALAAATELFGWMTRHPDHALAKALARPGQELQERLATDEPTADQLAVAGAALDACLRLEGVHHHA